MFVGFFDEVFKVFVAARVDIREGEIGELDAEAAHVETVGEGSENLQSFEGDFFLFVGGKGGKGAGVMETVGEFDDEDADVVAGGDHEAEEIVFSGGEISVEVLHVFTDLAELGDAVDKKGDRLAKFALDVFERDVGVFDRIMKNPGDNSVFVHAPFLEDFFDGERVDNVRFARPAGLAGVGLGCKINRLFNPGGIARVSGGGIDTGLLAWHMI